MIKFISEGKAPIPLNSTSFSQHSLHQTPAILALSAPLPPPHLFQGAFPDTSVFTTAHATQSHASFVVSHHGLPGT